jgi:hypothetical protein
VEHPVGQSVRRYEGIIMKRHISSLVFGAVGVAAGFALCFLYFVLHQREAVERGQEAQQAMTVFSKLSLFHDERGAYIVLPGMVRHE